MRFSPNMYVGEKSHVNTQHLFLMSWPPSHSLKWSNFSRTAIASRSSSAAWEGGIDPSPWDDKSPPSSRSFSFPHLAHAANYPQSCPGRHYCPQRVDFALLSVPLSPLLLLVCPLFHRLLFPTRHLHDMSSTSSSIQLCRHQLQCFHFLENQQTLSRGFI